MENLQASESRYRELDMPQEVMQLTKHQILSISVTAMLAHAQVQPESVIPLPRKPWIVGIVKSKKTSAPPSAS